MKGGGEAVESLRVGLLGFEREVEGIRKVVVERMGGVGEALGVRRGLRGEIGMGRGLLEVEVGMGELEVEMGIRSSEGEGLEEEEEEDDDDDEVEVDVGLPIRRLQRRAQQYLLITRQVDRIGPEHPFLQARMPRLDELRRTLLLDLAAALRQAKAAKAQDAVLSIVKMYADLDAERDGVIALKRGG